MEKLGLWGNVYVGLERLHGGVRQMGEEKKVEGNRMRMAMAAFEEMKMGVKGGTERQIVTIVCKNDLTLP